MSSLKRVAKLKRKLKKLEKQISLQDTQYVAFINALNDKVAELSEPAVATPIPTFHTMVAPASESSIVQTEADSESNYHRGCVVPICPSRQALNAFQRQFGTTDLQFSIQSRLIILGGGARTWDELRITALKPGTLFIAYDAYAFTQPSNSPCNYRLAYYFKQVGQSHYNLRDLEQSSTLIPSGYNVQISTERSLELTKGDTISLAVKLDNFSFRVQPEAYLSLKFIPSDR